MISRPLSPHLQIYRTTLSMAMSILHRLTGLGLVAGVIGFVMWLYLAAFVPSWFALAQGLFATWPGKVVLIGMSWAFIHHLLGGLRYLLWDTGRGFKLNHVEWLVRANMIGSLVLTAAIWICYGFFA